jgi:hypothetical protein
MSDNKLNNIFVSSHQKCGTILFRKILNALVQYHDLEKHVKDRYKEVIADVGDKFPHENVSIRPIRFNQHGALDVMFEAQLTKEDSLVDVESIIDVENSIGQDRLDKVLSSNYFVSDQFLGTKRMIAISDDLTKNILESNDFVYVGHTKPGVIFDTLLRDLIKNKIFLIRDFRDVYNSKTKFVSPETIDFTLMELLGSYEEYQRFRYLNLSYFHSYLDSWKSYVDDYLMHKDDMLLVRYEDLISDPHSVIKEVLTYIGLDINKAAIEKAIKDYFNVELMTDNKHKHFRHFSGSVKRSGEWMQFFNDDMVKIIKDKVGKHLIELGYEKDLDWQPVRPDNDALVVFHNRLDKAWANYKSQHFTAVEAAIAKIDGYLKDNSVVIYGAGLYARELCNRLRNIGSVVFFVDDDPNKAGTDINGIEVTGKRELIKRYLDYDKILIATHHQYHSAIYASLKASHIHESKIQNVYDDNISEYLLKPDKCF